MLDRELCAAVLKLNVGVAQPDNHRALELLSRIHPLALHTYESNREHNGWVVPKAWQVKRAVIASEDGVELFDGTVHPLAVAAYASSFSGVVDKEELDRHVFYSERFPDAYAFYSLGNYRPWRKHWGFCIPYEIYRSWGPGRYRVELAAEFTPGQMVVGECEHRGESDETVLLNAHTCHPCQANDDLSGELVLLEVFRSMRGTRTRYSYLGILAPEHVGTAFHVTDLKRRGLLERIKLGMFLEMLGTDTQFLLQHTFNGDTIMDRVAEHVIRQCDPNSRIAPFKAVVGNDESVWEAPGVEIPTISVSRFPYDEYHTSRDDLSIMSDERHAESVAVIQRMIHILESDVTVHRRFDGIVALSNPKYDLYVERPDPVVRKQLSEQDLRFGEAQDRLPRYFDGWTTAFTIAEAFGLSFEALLSYLRRFQAVGLVELRPVRSLDEYVASPRLPTHLTHI